MINLGDGTRREVDQFTANVVNTIAGDGTATFGGDGIAALKSGISSPAGLAVGPDGSVYFVDNRLIASFTSTRTESRPRLPGRAFGDSAATVVRRSRPSWRTRHRSPWASTAACTSADRSNSRVRRVAPNGVISTFVGTGLMRAPVEGSLANATLIFPRNVAVGPDGRVFISDAKHVWVVDQNGVINAYAGADVVFSGDGGPALQAGLQTQAAWHSPSTDRCSSSTTLAFARSRHKESFPPLPARGTAHSTATAVRRSAPASTDPGMSPSDVTEASTSRPRTGCAGSARMESSTPLQAMVRPRPFGRRTWTANGDCDRERSRHRSGSSDLHCGCRPPSNPAHRIRAARPFRFGHPRAFGGRARGLRFQWRGAASANRAFADRSHVADLQLRCRRLSDYHHGRRRQRHEHRAQWCRSDRVVAPFGQRTVLNATSDGWLSSVTDPAGQVQSMQYSASGLLQRLVDPRGNASRFTYDAVGRLIKDEDPAGGSTSLVRTEQANGFTVTATSALGRTRSFQVEQLSTGALRRTLVEADGTKTIDVTLADGSEQITDATGTVSNVTHGADPRWGMLAPTTSAATVSTPGGRQLKASEVVTTTLTDPQNPLTLSAKTDTFTINGRIHTSAFTAATRTAIDTSPLGRQQSVIIDNLGRPTQYSAPTLQPIVRSYDSHGLLQSSIEGSGADIRTSTIARTPMVISPT